MAIIRPSADLRNHYKDISELCKTTAEPVYITVIGAGSVVTRDIPSGVLAAGNPCRVIRKLTKEDSIYRKKGLFPEE